MSSKGKGVPRSGKNQSKSSRAGLVFPVGRIKRFLRDGRFSNRVSPGAPVFLAAVLEYMAAELLEYSGDVAKDNKRTSVTPRHIRSALDQDEEMNTLLRQVTISQGGVHGNIHSFLLRKARASKSSTPGEGAKKKRKKSKKKSTKSEGEHKKKKQSHKGSKKRSKGKKGPSPEPVSAS